MLFGSNDTYEIASLISSILLGLLGYFFYQKRKNEVLEKKIEEQMFTSKEEYLKYREQIIREKLEEEKKKNLGSPPSKVPNLTPEEIIKYWNDKLNKK